MTRLHYLLLIAPIIISLISVFTPVAKTQISPLRTVWENPYTLTTYHPGSEVNSTFYTFPKVIWNGSQYADYVFNSSDMSGGVGSVYVKVTPDCAVFYDPYRQEQRIGGESWIVEYYNASNCRWEIDYPKHNSVDSLVNSSGVYFDRTATLNSGAKLVVWYWLRVGSRMKICVELCPTINGRFRLVWLLGDVSGTRATWLTRTENVTAQLVSDQSCMSVGFADENESKCVLDWSDARQFNKTSLQWDTCFQQLEMNRNASSGRCEARVLFGDFSLLRGESMILDPTIVTFNSFEGDGHLVKYGRTHPPNEGIELDRIWEEFSTGQLLLDTYYFTYRGYLSFDTWWGVPALAYNISARLRLMTAQDYSTQDFTLQVMGGDQPIFSYYTYFLTTECWDKGQTVAGMWNTADYPGDDIYVDIPISPSQIDKWGPTQFELKSDREQTPPDYGVLEYVNFYSGSCVGKEPKLEVTYYVDTVSLGEGWYYRDAGASKAVIPLFGGVPLDWHVDLNTIEHEKSPGKVSFLDALFENGISVLTPMNDIAYYADSNWIQDAASWLMDVRGYINVFLFGFSAGGVAVAYEIQKDYATKFSAAVFSCAPVDNDEWNQPLYQSAHTASKAKTATCVPEPLEDDFRNQTLEYYDNLIVHKEEHDWGDGHNLFDFNCVQCPAQENLSTLVIDWFNEAHPPSTPFTPRGLGSGYTKTSYGYTSGTIDPNGDNVRYEFDWGDGTNDTTGYVSSGVNVTVSHSWNSTGIYNVTVRAQDPTNWSTWSPPKTVYLFGAGDINHDCIVDIYDAINLANAFNSNTSSPNWNSAADLNNDNTVDIYDAIILANNYGKSYATGSGFGTSGQPSSGGAMTAGGASVLVDPSQTTVFKGEVFNVNVKVTSVTDLLGWEFKLYWNNTLLNCTNFVIQTPTEWQGNAQNYGQGLEAGYNATHARLWIAQTAKYPAPSFNGSMTLATLTFQALQPGTTTLALMETKLGNSTADPIDHTESSGSVSVDYGRYMRSDTQQVNGLSAYKLNIPQSASSALYTQSGSGAGALFGIRAWVRHSNGVEQEISLDGQTGTPKATVGGGWAGIRSSTVSVAQTALQSTDSLVVRVYVQIADGPWSLCATFTTEQLQSSTLKATVWTVYYYTSSTYNRVTDRTTAKFYWGTTTYNSRIQNLQYS